MAFVKLATSTQKCATCDRWSGSRQRSADGSQVEFDDGETNGICAGGPWDGNVRHPLTRCGRWIIWVVPQ
ncbi:protein of unknown function [Georgfuchsia toluolica]|uniref:Uncharacterized protein n=1 Tax=Georgfuchsia toluolica TaxID=424218 RepID=A0A916J3W4_9PROT|nr:hypothetical protein [Georgfuchsia toluolica]CAG4883385.1 protein of unknown function [Georgfuchsia toluolica]